MRASLRCGVGNKQLVDECQERTAPRAALYIDGFNLYHPIHEMNKPYLKWLDLWRLGKIISAPNDIELVKVVFCTAVPDHRPDRKVRHISFNSAQRAKGVDVVLGHHVSDGEKYNEKQSDINLALHLIMDAVSHVYDVAILLRADSDQAATATMLKSRFPEKLFIGVAPPSKDVPSKMFKHCWKRFSLTEAMIEPCVMEEHVQGKNGIIRRPVEYAPPPEWMHPDLRPVGKPPKAPPKGSWTKGVKS